jgi:hypothetical protein
MIHLFIAACYTPWLLLRKNVSFFNEEVCKAVSSPYKIQLNPLFFPFTLYPGLDLRSTQYHRPKFAIQMETITKRSLRCWIISAAGSLAWNIHLRVCGQFAFIQIPNPHTYLIAKFIFF